MKFDSRFVVEEAKGGKGHSFRYEPGNGSSYIVRITRIDPAECKILNCSPHSIMFTIGTGKVFTSYPIQFGGTFTPGYIAGVFNLDMSDAEALTPFVAQLASGTSVE